MATLYAKNKITGEFEKVGPVASADGSVGPAIATHNIDSAAHADIREQINTLSNEKVDLAAQAEPPENTNALWVDTSEDDPAERMFANPLVGKILTVNGDSICNGYDGAGGYGSIIATRNNMTFENVAHGGATVTAETYSNSTGNPLHWISRTISEMREDADYAIVEGGVNDPNYVTNMGSLSSGYNATLDDTTFYGAFESMLKQLILRFPGKKIGYIAVHIFTGEYYEAAKKCCTKWGVPFCDLSATVPPFGRLAELKDIYTFDGTHPNALGYEKFYCDKIEAWMKTL